MSQGYDPTVKALVEIDPPSWLPVLGRAMAPVTIIDPDIGTPLSGAADKFLHVHADPQYILHLDFQSGHDSARLPARLRLYNTVADYRTGLPVRSVAVVLHPGADSPQLTGQFVRQLPGEEPYDVFRYDVLRVWQLPVGPLLTGGVGTLPLAPISAVPESDLPGVIRHMKERLRREDRARDLWTATRILLGVRCSRDVINMLLRGVLGMKESVTYQEIVAEGRAEGHAEEARRVLLMLGEESFGAPDASLRAAIAAIEDLERLEQLIKQTRRAESWQELLAPARRRPNSRRRTKK